MAEDMTPEQMPIHQKQETSAEAERRSMRSELALRVSKASELETLYPENGPR